MTADGRDAPAWRALDIDAELSDANDLSATTRAIYVGTSGDIKVTMLDGTTITLRNVQTGTFYPICVKRVWSTGTTAANLVGLY